jgi:chromosome segregation ATPase
MKKIILTFALGMILTAAPAFAYESRHEESRADYSDRGRNSLDRHVNHLNRMLQHVRWQVRQYRADWRARRDVDQISRETDRLNHRFRSGDYNRGRLRAEIDRLHDRLHAIEERLHVRSRDIYRWD